MRLTCDGSRAADGGSRAWLVLAVAASIAFVALALDAAGLETPTVDEFVHVPAGVAHWRAGRLDLCSTNPSLPKLWIALPLALDSGVTAPPVLEQPLGWGPWRYGSRFMDANRAAYFDLFLRARAMVIAVGLATGWLVFFWARALFGIRAAAVTMTLFLLCPNWLAHGHLATIDVPCAFALALAMFALRWAYQRPSAARFAVTGVALGLALSTKFLVLGIVPAVFVLALLHRWQGGEEPAGRRVGLAVGDMAWISIVALFVVNASMGFQGSFQPLGSYTLRSGFGNGVQAVLPAWLPVPTPRQYAIGFDAAKKISESTEMGSYLLGEWSREGWWYYNLVAFGVKMPLAFLALLVAAPVFWWRSSAPRMELVSLLVPALGLLLVFSALNHANIGIRHVLPVLPFLFVLIAPVFVAGTTRARHWLAGGVTVAALAAYAINVARIHPDYLTYFNAIAGGPEGGRHWLIDSNLDWGQDLYRVREAVERLHPEGPPYLLYFGHADPKLYGLEYALLPSAPVRGVIAVSANFLEGFPYVATAPDGRMVQVPRDAAKWLEAYEPVERIGSILIFDTRGAPAIGPAP